MVERLSRSIIVTGAASGIGRATALLFARRGWFVGGFDTNVDGLSTLASELGPQCMTGILDVTSRTDFGRVADLFSSASGGHLDVLFNNAGTGRGGGPFDKVSFDDVAAAVQVNLLGVLSGIHACLPLLRRTPNSLCISTSSSTAIFGLPNMAAYSATKCAVRGLTEALSLEFRAHGVRVADVLPGLVATPLIGKNTSASTHGGPFRVIQADQVAEVVWQAYKSDQLHWYAPPDLGHLAIEAATDPEGFREKIHTRTGAYSWMAGG